jgi:hypothetical protein
MATTLENLLNNAERKGIVGRKSEDSIKWFRDNARKTTKTVNSTRLMREEKDNLVNSWTNVGIGKLYFVNYDPKHKSTLPYYDTFPLVIPIHFYKDGFLGLNLHYLPPILRAKLLDALYDTLTNDKFNDRTKMRITYSILSSAAKYRHFEPCVKRYLGKHFRSRFIRVPPDAWTPAVFLPVEGFEKASTKKVWADSRSKIK